jgi:hypothetical protein
LIVFNDILVSYLSSFIINQFQALMMIFFSHQNTVLRGSGVANFEKPAVGSVSRYRLDSPPLIDMEVQIHQLEQDAYSAVLRAFKAQSDALTWVCIFS